MSHSLQQTICIGSKNSLPAVQRAYTQIESGSDTLDAIIDGIGIVEDDPFETSVGYGGLPNELGIVELDAAVMHGPSGKGGAVSALRNIRYPLKVAKLVMERTDHVLLTGEGAFQFARTHGFPEESLLTERARKIWLYWKETRSRQDDWIPPSFEELDADVVEFFQLAKQHSYSNFQDDMENPSNVEVDPSLYSYELPSSQKKQSADPLNESRPSGTIHCSARNRKGELSCATSPVDWPSKFPAGSVIRPLLVQDCIWIRMWDRAEALGEGEVNLIHCSSVIGVELMRQGASPREAGMELLQRIAKNTPKRLLNSVGLPLFDVKFFLLRSDGEYAGVSMWGPASFAIADNKGSRLEEAVSLYQRSEKST